MKRIALIAVAALVAVGLVPATAGAGTADTGQVTIVHDFTWDASSVEARGPLCVDGVEIDADFGWGDVIPAESYAAGGYDVALMREGDTCGDERRFGAELIVEAGDDITLAAVDTRDFSGFLVWANDSSCHAPGEARVTVRHGGDTTREDNPSGDVDVSGTIGGVELALISELGEGEQATIDSPAPATITDGQVVGTESDEVFVDFGTLDLAPGVHYVIYAGGGNDGDVGVFVDMIDMVPCDVPVDPTTTTTTTTAGPTPSTTAAAQPARVTPAFTG